MAFDQTFKFLSMAYKAFPVWPLFISTNSACSTPHSLLESCRIKSNTSLSALSNLSYGILCPLDTEGSIPTLLGSIMSIFLDVRCIFHSENLPWLSHNLLNVPCKPQLHLFGLQQINVRCLLYASCRFRWLGSVTETYKNPCLHRACILLELSR